MGDNVIRKLGGVGGKINSRWRSKSGRTGDQGAKPETRSPGTQSSEISKFPPKMAGI